WTGRVLGGLPALFLLLNGATALFKPPMVVEGTVKLGFPESSILILGLCMLTGAILYLVPRTSVLGAIFLTGYLGGAVATPVRMSERWFNTLFPVLFAALLWAGLWLRDNRVSNMLASAHA